MELRYEITLLMEVITSYFTETTSCLNLSFSDRIRTSINVMGDAIGAGIVDHMCRKELRDIDAEVDREYGAVLTEYNKRVSGPTSPTDRIPPDSRRASKKRMSVAAAMRLQENATPLAVAMATHSSMDDHQAFGHELEPIEDIDA